MKCKIHRAFLYRKYPSEITKTRRESARLAKRIQGFSGIWLRKSIIKMAKNVTSNFSMTFEFIEVNIDGNFFDENFIESTMKMHQQRTFLFLTRIFARARAVLYNRVNGNGSIARSIWNEIVISMFPFTRAYVALLFRGNGSTYVPGAAS